MMEKPDSTESRDKEESSSPADVLQSLSPSIRKNITTPDDKKSNSKKATPAKSAHRFSKSTIRKCMKLNSEVHMISADAVLCVLKATEVFMESLVKNSYVVSLANNRKSLKVIWDSLYYCAFWFQRFKIHYSL